MKRTIPFLLVLSMLLSGCYITKSTDIDMPGDIDQPSVASPSTAVDTNETIIYLSDKGTTVDGTVISSDQTQAVYAANDIVYYHADQGFTYGAGTAVDEHSAEEAAAHTVVHITQPGTYRLNGALSKGQIAVDLGDGAEDDPNAVVNLILDGISIECTVAPAIIFYNVYECGNSDNPGMTVDTTAAGANIIIADNSQASEVTGSYVARIYKSYTLNEDGTEVVDNKKLHKYDGALYSRMSMNVSGGNNGKLIIRAENEGLDSEMHLTVNSGCIDIIAGNDGINTNEDNISVTTINGGNINIIVDGSTGEGDAIDSNGWLVINGGNVTALACSSSADSGLDADMGVYINGGNVVATGNMLDAVYGSQTYAAFSFAGRQSESSGTYSLKNAQGETVMQATPANAFSYLLFSSPDLIPGSYTLWLNETQLVGSSGNSFGGGFGGDFGRDFNIVDLTPPNSETGNTELTIPSNENGTPPARPDNGFDMVPPEHNDGFDDFERPDDFSDFDDDFEIPPDGFGDRRLEINISPAELSGDFVIDDGSNFFSNVQTLE